MQPKPTGFLRELRWGSHWLLSTFRRDELLEATGGPDAAGAALSGEDLLDWLRARHVEDGERDDAR